METHLTRNRACVMARQRMIQWIKNLFKKESPSAQYCTICSIWFLNKDHRCPLEAQTYKIFKKTPHYNEIPLENQAAFLNHCKDLLADEILQRIIDEEVATQAESIIQSADSLPALLQWRYRMLGADAIRVRLQLYANKVEKPETFNKHDPI